jgi:flagellar motor switch protein FliM
VQIRAVLDDFNLTLKDVLNWKVGTRLPLNATPVSNVELLCGDLLMFNGKMGRKGGNIAVRIEEKVEKKQDR